MNKVIHIFGGGTVYHMRSHLALSAPAYGTLAKQIYDECVRQGKTLTSRCYLTKMAGGYHLETNQDVEVFLRGVVKEPSAKIVFFTVAMCDFTGQVGEIPGDKYGTRLSSSEPPEITLHTAPKVVKLIRQHRKDIFAVACKTTCGATEDEQYIAGLNLLKEASLNLVVANDVKTRVSMIITPEEARYCVTTDRVRLVQELVEMTLKRSHLTFTRSTVVAGETVPWDSPEVPEALRAVVNHCIQAGAYKPFRGATVGHFAAKIGENTFLTSIRKTNFNDLDKTGLVRIVTDGPDSVIAYGAKPSVGGQSQRIVFHDHKDYDCIVHFHCPIKPTSQVPQVSQRDYECGSHECGRNTSQGLQVFGNLSAVYLQEHGPNIVFHHSINPREVIEFIEDNFDLDKKTGGYVNLGQILSTPNTLETLHEALRQRKSPYEQENCASACIKKRS